MKLGYHLAIAAAMLALARLEDGALVLALGTCVWFGLDMARRMRPEVAGLIGREGRPGLQALASVPLALVTAFLAYGAIAVLIDLFFRAPTAVVRAESKDVLFIGGSLVAVAWLALATAPAVRRLAQRDPEASVWPAVAGLLGAVICGAVIALQWNVFAEPLIKGTWSSRRTADWVMVSGWMIFAFGVGGALWWRAVARGSGHSGAELFRAGATAGLVGWGAQAGITVAMLALTFAGYLKGGRGGAWAIAGVFVVLQAMMWLSALRRMRRLRAAGPVRASMALLVLLVMFWISLFIPNAVLHSDDWAWLTAMLCVLPLAAVLAASLELAPRLIRAIAGEETAAAPVL